jgi:hypothetical protein
LPLAATCQSASERPSSTGAVGNPDIRVVPEQRIEPFISTTSRGSGWLSLRSLTCLRVPGRTASESGKNASDKGQMALPIRA